MLAHGPMHLTPKCANKTSALTITANDREKYSSEMNLNIEFKSSSQVNEINDTNNVDVDNDNSNKINNDIDDSNKIDIENDDRNNFGAGVEVEEDV